MAENIQEEIENKIIDLVAFDAGGRLVIFKPENSDKDLVVEKKGEYKKKAFFLNIYGIEGSDINEKIRQLIDKNKIKAENNLYLVFVTFDVIRQDINDSLWVIPSLDLSKISKTKDLKRFLTTKKDFVRFLIDISEKK